MARSRTIGAVLTAIAGGLVARGVYEHLERFEVSEASMSPTLHPGDYVLTWSSSAAPRRGTIVVFEDPRRPDFWLVKRIIGLPGEMVEIADGKVSIDGKALDEPWTDEPTTPDGSWQLGEAEAFVLGDLRHRSAGDSRRLGPLPVESLRRRVVFRYWPDPRIMP